MAQAPSGLHRLLPCSRARSQKGITTAIPQTALNAAPLLCVFYIHDLISCLRYMSHLTSGTPS